MDGEPRFLLAEASLPEVALIPVAYAYRALPNYWVEVPGGERGLNAVYPVKIELTRVTRGRSILSSPLYTRHR